jgi:hypothetical protein
MQFSPTYSAYSAFAERDAKRERLPHWNVAGVAGTNEPTFITAHLDCDKVHEMYITVETCGVKDTFLDGGNRLETLNHT